MNRARVGWQRLWGGLYKAHTDASALYAWDSTGLKAVFLHGSSTCYSGDISDSGNPSLKISWLPLTI